MGVDFNFIAGVWTVGVWASGLGFALRAPKKVPEALLYSEVPFRTSKPLNPKPLHPKPETLNPSTLELNP